MTTTTQNLDELSINTIRTLSIDTVQKANSGHPGLPMGAAAMAYVLWTRFMKFNPRDPGWFDRDRFVLSAGHGSALLYSLLYLTGYDLGMDDLQQFRQWESKTPGHPEYRVTPGVEVTTGPLGQGFANAVGMAMAEAFLGATFNKPGHEIINHYTYGICSDGDLMEGVCAEAASLAGHLKLGKLIFLYDDNSISLDGDTEMAFTEDRALRFEAMGWHVQRINGMDIGEVERAMRAAQEARDRPSLIDAKTHIGYGAPHKQDSSKAHGNPLGEDEVRAAKQFYGWDPDKQFYVPDDALANFRKAVDRGREWQQDWQQRWESYEQAYPDEARTLTQAIHDDLPAACFDDLPRYSPNDKPKATRNASGDAINVLAKHLPTLFGGSADLKSSTETEIRDDPPFEPGSYAGRNIWFGVREHAMGAAVNGMTAHGGIYGYGGTFFNFSDYMRGAVRLAALMNLPSIFVWTHDSIGLGEDGPTHQPIEQLMALRAMPELTLIRPADGNETSYAWRAALENKKHPTGLVLARQTAPYLDQSKYGSAEGLLKGAYVLLDAPNGRPEVILIGTGTEVQLALAAAEQLRSQGIMARAVSMPSWELFERQSQEYRDSVLPPAVKARVSVEAGTTFGWCKYVGDQGQSVGVDHFGASAPGGTVMKQFGFTVENVVQHAMRALGR
ncbi:MAG: transketolase [Dehalococcoidia bacterium]